MDLASPPAHETYSPGRAGPSDRRDEDCDTDSLTWVARHAWRMADRCVGRSGWRSLIVRNRTHLTELGDIVEDLEEHLRLTTNDGRIRPVATVYHPSIRFRAEQLIRYAGDPQYAGYAATCHRLGWRSNGDQFDILPVSFELPDGSLHLASLDRSVILEVPIGHPTAPWFSGLGLRWHAAPVISNMLLRNEGRYWPCVFGGWYATDEIAGRDLAPERRFDAPATGRRGARPVQRPPGRASLARPRPGRAAPCRRGLVPEGRGDVQHAPAGGGPVPSTRRP